MSERENAKTVTREVIVHKAEIPMEPGESVYDFTSALSKAANESVRKSLGLGDGDYLWTAEVYKAEVIFEVNKGGTSGNYYSTTYKRSAVDKFDFGTLTKVKRKVTYAVDTKVKKAKESAITTMEVVVHKAAIPLMKGESISKFTTELSNSGREHIFKKLNMSQPKDYAWMVEAFGDAVVFNTYKSVEPSTYHVFKYTRDAKTGVFEFGDVTEVEKVVGYKPKTLSVTKANGLWKGVL